MVPEVKPQQAPSVIGPRAARSHLPGVMLPAAIVTSTFSEDRSNGAMDESETHILSSDEDQTNNIKPQAEIVSSQSDVSFSGSPICRICVNVSVIQLSLFSVCFV